MTELFQTKVFYVSVVQLVWHNPIISHTNLFLKYKQSNLNLNYNSLAWDEQMIVLVNHSIPFSNPPKQKAAPMLFQVRPNQFFSLLTHLSEPDMCCLSSLCIKRQILTYSTISLLEGSHNWILFLADSIWGKWVLAINPLLASSVLHRCSFKACSGYTLLTSEMKAVKDQVQRALAVCECITAERDSSPQLLKSLYWVAVKLQLDP